MNTNKEQFKEILEIFIKSYAERNQGESFPEWFESRLKEEMPEISEETGRKLTGEIINGIANYNNTLNEVNAAAEKGISKDEWLAEKLGKACSDMPVEQAGNTIVQIEEAYLASNNELIKELDPDQPEIIIEEKPKEWNKFKLKSKLLNVGNQLALNGVAVMANALKNKVQDGENAVDKTVKNTIADAVKETFENGLINNPDEVKAVVAGAVKVAAEKGLDGVLSEVTNTETICDIAGVSVEGAKVVFDLANGKCKVSEAVEGMGRAAVAAGCNIGKECLERGIINVPYVGPALRFLLDGLIEHMGTEKFHNNVFTLVKDAAVATWNGLKNNVRKLGYKIKNTINALFAH